MPCHEVFKIPPLFFFFNFACAKKDMENNLSLTIAVPEDHSLRVSISSLTLWEIWLLLAPKAVPLRQEAAKTYFLGCFVCFFFKEQGECCLGKELEEKTWHGLFVGTLTHVR